MLVNNQMKPSFDVYYHSLALEFYSNVLRNSTYLQLPLNQLMGHRGQAPPEVQRVAVNEMDLKKFLARYPSIFTVTANNCVKLVKPIVDCRIPRERVNLKVESSNNSDMAVQYYANVMKKKMTTGDHKLPLERLFGHRSQASTAVQNCAKNLNELYSFLCNHPETFTVLPGDIVTLSKSASVTNDKNEGQNNSTKLKYDEDDSAAGVKYYSKILNTTGPNYSILSLIGHRGQAPAEVQKVAFTDSDLKLFLSRFPNIFTITGNFVTLKKVSPVLDSNNEKRNLKSGSYLEKRNPDVAVQFYANILKEKGYYGKEFPIQKLTGYGNKAPVEVQNCARNPNELYKLFSNYPKVFTVISKKSVILIESPLNNIVSKVQNLSLTSDDSSNSTKAIEYYVNILRHQIPNSEFPIAKLMLYFNRAPAEVCREARNKEELIIFFLKHPHIFTVIQNQFVKLTEKPINSNNIIQNTKLKLECIRNLNVDKRAKTLRYFPSLECPENPGFSGTWENHVLDNTILVTEEDECLEACEVIRKEIVIALDCEGYNLGRGIMSLIQIALVNGKVYIFDIYELPRMISLGLKEIIESDKILKVINYCRNDCLNLKMQYNVDLKYIFDVSVAYHVIENKIMSLSNFKPAGFNQICAKYGVPTNSCKDDLKFIYLTQPNYWVLRPLNMKMVSYAAFDVASLVPYLYCEFLKRMDQETELAVWKLSQKMCIT